MDSQDRYSQAPPLWPQGSLPLPRIAHTEMALTLDGWLITEGRPRSLMTAPAEMHLRELRDCELSSPQSLKDVTSAVGLMVAPDDRGAGIASRRGHPMGEWLHQQAVENVAQQLGLPIPDWSRLQDDGFDSFTTIHVAEVAHRIVMLRAMVDHVDRALSLEPTAPVWAAAGQLDDPDEMGHFTVPGETPWDEEPSEKVAWLRFAQTLNAGLKSISPRLVPPLVDTEPDFDDVVDAYTASCVMVFNDLAEGIPYRRCQDETCGRIFRFQRGRGAGVHKRSVGVAYCTPTHARNQSQRERRRAARAHVQNDGKV